MTERKPTGLSWESWTEKQIEEGRRAGLFDGLDGMGRPIEGLDGPHDEEWWVKAKLRRENIDYLPPTIAIRGERDVAVAAALAARDEGEARRILREVNDRIRYVNSHKVSGPPSTVWVVDEESIVERWRADHPVVACEPEEDSDPEIADRPSDPARRRLWRRRPRAS
jgi:hypothetical protein